MAVDNKYITVAYKLYAIDNGEEDPEAVEECTAEHPFQFISQLGVVLPAFEAGVASVAKGETFDFIIPCKDAYGEFNEEMMFDVPKKIFMNNGKLDDRFIYEGAVVPMQGEDGSRFNATIIEIKAEEVTIDLNHPRAGVDLHFVGQVIENRNATNDEVAELLNAMSGCGGGCGSCGGGCGNCGDGCSSCGDGCGGCE
ncbi:MAG: FKBP-type peptidyl-prolyl cis-trans isomerase [Bacteroidaceae bacterium]|nr:FKBP-type peptidyl-prolyl cis-trans isomerase [Bacteroidaceae bacterium]